MPWPLHTDGRPISGAAPGHPQYLRDWGKHTHGSPLCAQLVEVAAGIPTCCESSIASSTRLVIDDGSRPTTVGQAHPHGEWIELF